MSFNYLIYPKALEKIKSSGLEAKVEKIKNSKDGLGYIGGAVYADEIFRDVQNLQKRGYYKHLPNDFKEKYIKIMNEFIKKPEDCTWTIQRPAGTETAPSDMEDLLLFTGVVTSMILRQKEMWDYKKFGFSSPSGFLATMSAYIMQQSRRFNFDDRGYIWTRKRADGSEIKTEVTGSEHCDLRIFQTDIAPYPTIDPFGNPIEMRPETRADRHTVSAYHSTEDTLLVAVMKYIEQHDIAAEFRKDNARQLIDWGRSLGQGGGTCAEHFFGGIHQDLIMPFVGYDRPIPQLDQDNQTDQHSNFWLSTESEGAYAVYIANNGDLVMSYHNEKEILKSKVKPISARFLPEDAEHLIKGLIYQAAKGLGRTSAGHLLNILAYRYSSQFEEDKKRLNF